MPSLAAKTLILLSGVSSWVLTAPTVTLGAELLTNPGGPFTFTGDDPDGWTVIGESGSDPMVSEVATGEAHADAPTPGGEHCNIYTTGAYISISQDIATVGLWYLAEIIIDTYTDGALKFETGVTRVGANITADKASTFRAADTNVRVTRSGSADITVASASLKRLTSMLSGIDTNRTRQTVRSGLTITDEYQAGVWSDGDDATTPDNYLLAYYDRLDAKVHLCKYLVDGSFDSEVGSYAAVYSAGATLKITPDGNDRIVSYNDVDLVTYTLTDAALIAGTCAGLFSTGNSNAFSTPVAEV